MHSDSIFIFFDNFLQFIIFVKNEMIHNVLLMNNYLYHFCLKNTRLFYTYIHRRKLYASTHIYTYAIIHIQMHLHNFYIRKPITCTKYTCHEHAQTRALPCTEFEYTYNFTCVYKFARMCIVQ